MLLLFSIPLRKTFFSKARDSFSRSFHLAKQIYLLCIPWPWPRTSNYRRVHARVITPCARWRLARVVVYHVYVCKAESWLEMTVESTWRFLLVARQAATLGLWHAIPRVGELPFLKGFSLWTNQSERVYFYWPPGPNPVVTISTRVGPGSRLLVVPIHPPIISSMCSNFFTRLFFFKFLRLIPVPWYWAVCCQHRVGVLLVVDVMGGWATHVVCCAESQLKCSPPLLSDLDILCEIEHEGLAVLTRSWHCIPILQFACDCNVGFWKTIFFESALPLGISTWNLAHFLHYVHGCRQNVPQIFYVLPRYLVVVFQSWKTGCNVKNHLIFKDYI